MEERNIIAIKTRTLFKKDLTKLNEWLKGVLKNKMKLLKNKPIDRSAPSSNAAFITLEAKKNGRTNKGTVNKENNGQSKLSATTAAQKRPQTIPIAQEFSL